MIQCWNNWQILYVLFKAEPLFWQYSFSVQLRFKKKKKLPPRCGSYVTLAVFPQTYFLKLLKENHFRSIRKQTLMDSHCVVLWDISISFVNRLVKLTTLACSCLLLKTPGTHSWKIDLSSWSIYQGSEFKPSALCKHEVRAPRGRKGGAHGGGYKKRQIHKVFWGEALNQSCSLWEHYSFS